MILRKKIFAALFCLTTAAVSAQADDDRVATGSIAAIDGVNRRVTLTDGRTFIADGQLKLSSRSVGERVIIFYRAEGQKRHAIRMRRVPERLERLPPPHHHAPKGDNRRR